MPKEIVNSMEYKKYIVAIELGSSAIRGIAGSRLPDGCIQVDRIVQIPTNECVRRGVIYNIDKTTDAIQQVKETLENDLKVKVKKAYVGIHGQSMRTVRNCIRNVFNHVKEVTDPDIDNLLDRNNATDYGDCEILEIIPQEYHLDIKDEDDPKGIQTHIIEGRFNNIVARRILRENILKCMNGAGLYCAGLLLSPLVLADYIMNDAERRSGCALVDFGAQTTTVQVYKGNKLRYLSTIPLGGASLTRDIASAKDLDDTEAEALKLAHGVAIVDLTKEENASELPITGGRTISLSLLERITEARSEEILRNVGECIRRSEVSDQLTSGIIFTGGGSRLKDLARAYMVLFPSFTKVDVACPVIADEDLVDYGSGLQGGNFDTLVALLSKGEETCTEFIVEREPEPEQTQLFDDDAFDDDDNTEPESKGLFNRLSKNKRVQKYLKVYNKYLQEKK